ncbi:MAG TPA: MarR family transcriptional regulator [Rhizomicrobium sp.]|nr:MarR family transcriptional regulator [Rhizomicrobium sp.]
MKPAAKANPLEAHVGFWLRYVSNHVSQAFANKLAGHGVTVAEWVMLRELFGKDDVAPSIVAERMGMTRGAISKLADRLADKRLILKRGDRDDRRFQSLTLTKDGRAMVPVLAALADENDAEFFDHLSRAERERLVATLQTIVNHKSLKTIPTS